MLASTPADGDLLLIASFRFFSHPLSSTLTLAEKHTCIQAHFCKLTCNYRHIPSNSLDSSGDMLNMENFLDWYWCLYSITLGAKTLKMNSVIWYIISERSKICGCFAGERSCHAYRRCRCYTAYDWSFSSLESNPC